MIVADDPPTFQLTFDALLLKLHVVTSNKTYTIVVALMFALRLLELCRNFRLSPVYRFAPSKKLILMSSRRKRNACRAFCHAVRIPGLMNLVDLIAFNPFFE